MKRYIVRITATSGSEFLGTEHFPFGEKEYAPTGQMEIWLEKLSRKDHGNWKAYIEISPDGAPQYTDVFFRNYDRAIKNSSSHLVNEIIERVHLIEDKIRSKK